MAKTCYWNGGTDNNWDNYLNWWTNGSYNVHLAGNTIPQNGDSVDLSNYGNAIGQGPSVPVSIAAAYMGDAGPMAGNWTFGANLTCGPLSITSPSGTISITVNGTLGNITSTGGGAPTLTLAIAAGAVCGTVPPPFQGVSLGNNCTVGAIGNSSFMVPISSCGTGVTFTGSVYCGGSVSIGTGAVFTSGSTIRVDGGNLTVGANWKIGSGAAGSNLAFAITNCNMGYTLTVNSFAVPAQSSTFSSLSFSAANGGNINISALPAVTVTTGFTLSVGSGASVTLPSGSWATLDGSAATFNYNGLIVGIGHVPAITAVLTTDTLFGAPGQATPASTQLATDQAAVLAGAANILSTATILGQAGTFVLSTWEAGRNVDPGITTVLSPASGGPTNYKIAGSTLVGTATLPTSTTVLDVASGGSAYGVGGNGTTGIFDESTWEAGRNTDPTTAKVKKGTTYTIRGNSETGTYSPPPGGGMVNIG